MSGKPKDVADVIGYNEVRRVRVGDMVAALNNDGTVTLSGNKLIGREMTKLTREDVQDLLVALDGVIGDQPEIKPADMRDAIISGAHALARDIYRMTARRATVDVNLHPDVFYRIATTDDGENRRRIDKYDYERGRVRVSDDVEISLARELAK